MTDACPCWANTYSLGHEGHCCFVRDEARNQTMPSDERWRPEVCHVEQGKTLIQEVPC